jgi:hypothetical protein
MYLQSNSSRLTLPLRLVQHEPLRLRVKQVQQLQVQS